MAKTDKIDLYKTHKDEYVQPKRPVLIETTPANYLAIEGRGAPGGEEFQERVGALYSMAYTIKMTRKFAGQQDYVVCKLEGQWWVEGAGDAEFAKAPKDQWRWRLLIRTPDFITQADLANAVETLKQKGKSPLAEHVALEALDEGRCVQMLHVGPYDRVGDVVAAMESFMNERGLSRAGRHHEIYLSDPRRVPPERLKTIIRIPVTEAWDSEHSDRLSSPTRASVGGQK